ncbi:MAG: DEAD/DEAH box helicase [Longispora sp.]|nr:DEAD/DEAH box helicase [Longispora sp. (in: high G+C Gram-positive bacteria)]
MSFADLGLPNNLIRALSERGLEAPFAIQTVAIPDAMSGLDVLGRASTGSGKTLAFGLPVISRLAGRVANPHKPLALILVPTRELAMQVAEALDPLAWAMRLRVRTAVGGVRYERQIDALKRGTEILVATPGRLTDLCERSVCDLSEIEIAVLDEADQMCDMGFQADVMEILDRTPERGQRLLFSATLDGDVDQLVRGYMKDPVTHSVAPAEASVDTMDHHVLMIPPREKFSVIAEIANRSGKTIMFVRTQMAVDRVTEQLLAAGVKAVGLHGGKPQGQRTRTLEQFKGGVVNVLVATDVAARGIHVDNVSLVVHIDPPRDSKDYLHRAGRTARAGESGRVVTLGLPKQRRSINQLMDKAGVTSTESRVRPGDERLVEITGSSAPSYEPTTVPEPRSERGRGGSSGGRDRSSGPRRDGGFRGRSEGGYQGRPQGGGFRGRTGEAPREGGGFRGRTGEAPREGGGYRGRSEGGFQGRTEGPRPEYRDNRESRGGGDSREGGQFASRDAGFRGRTEGGGDSSPRRGAYSGEYRREVRSEYRGPRDGDARGGGREGGFQGRPEGGGFRGRPDSGQRSHGGSTPQRDGGFRGRTEGGPRGEYKGARGGDFHDRRGEGTRGGPRG